MAALAGQVFYVVPFDFDFAQGRLLKAPLHPNDRVVGSF
jgi:hypothetical protein